MPWRTKEGLSVLDMVQSRFREVQGGRLLRLAGLLRGTADSAGPGPHDPGR